MLEGGVSPVRALTAIAAEQMRREFRIFVKRAWPLIVPTPVIWNWHMDALCEHLAYVTMGEIRFLMIGIPPRMSKTMISSVMWPCWHWLHVIGEQFLTASVDENLAVDAARLSRRLMESSWFQNLYPGQVVLHDDENQAKLYRNTRGGYRQVASVAGNVTGWGGSVQILDDAHNAKKVESDAIRQATLQWHDNAWRSRLNNPMTAKKVYIGQRTHEADVYGHVLAQEGYRWVNLVMPLEFDPKRICITYPNKGKGVEKGAKVIYRDPRTIEGEILDPKRFDAETAKIEKSIMSDRAWAAQYQQAPVGQGGFIFKRDKWRQWTYPEWHKEAGKERDLPEFFEIIQVYDTAFEEKEEADFSARTTWGIFTYDDADAPSQEKNRRRGVGRRVGAMLLDRLQERLSYPDLRDEVIASDEAFSPDWILVEKKASGHSLVQELRRKRLPVKAVSLAGSSGRGRGSGDLIARAHEASLMLDKGCIFYVPRKWAFEVIENASKFPNAEHDDLVATLVIAWQYMRRYYDLTLPDDETDEIAPFGWGKKMRYA